MDSNQLSIRATRRSTLSLRQILRRHRVTIGLAVCASVFASGSALAQPALLNQLIGSIESGRNTRPLLIGLVTLLVANVLTASLQQYLVDTTAEKIVWSIRKGAIEHALMMPLERLRRLSAPQVISRVGQDAATLRTALTGGIFDSFGNALLMIGSLIAMAVVDIYLLLVTLAVVIASFSIVLGVFRLTRASSRRNQEALADVTTSLHQALFGIRTIRVYNAMKKTSSSIQLLLDSSKDAGIRLARIQAVVAPANGLAVQGAVLAVLGVGGFRVAEGSLTIGELVTFVAYLFFAVVPMSQLLSAIGDVSVASGALDRIRDLVAERHNDDGRFVERFDDPPSSQSLRCDDNEMYMQTVPALVVENVSYQHGESGFCVHGASFALDSGSMTALVGPSGSGKSTLLDLISGLIEADSGSIRADQLVLGKSEIDAWRSRIAYVEQSHGIITGTVRENLQIGRPGASDEELKEVLDSVNLGRLAEQSPQGLESVITDDGAGLSGGERQRLAIARAILSKRPIILLDEPSANLDADNIDALIEILESLKGERTVLVSTHSALIADLCDRVLYVEDGGIRSRNTHQMDDSLAP